MISNRTSIEVLTCFLLPIKVRINLDIYVNKREKNEHTLQSRNSVKFGHQELFHYCGAFRYLMVQ